jgi:hypothetical protein
MNKSYFTSLTNDLVERSANSVIGLLNIANAPLTKFLKNKFVSSPGEQGCFLGDPVFEGKFGWKESDVTMQDLSGNLLSPALVKAMANPPKELQGDYSFKSSWCPYTHQVISWQNLLQKEPKSAIITSGTGSGKTECFLVPVLNSLQTQAEQGSGLQGCRALFLYPLNALINSQRDRLRAWTHGLDKQVRFCLYNGETSHLPQRKQSDYPREVDNRKDLRAYVPPLLVTNATMLEYMLVRKDDKPIIEQSKGKLEWIILDEAHTYLGSQAAELSLLLRRVVSSFEVDPKNVRFIATSATIGGKDSQNELQKFLADIAGVPLEQVIVVGGEREFPPLETHKKNNQKLRELESIDCEDELSEERFAALSANEASLKLRSHFVKNDPPVASLTEVCTALFGDSQHTNEQRTHALRWLDICSGTSRHLADGRLDTYLPLRIHLFHTTMAGLWVCIDKECKCKPALLNDPKWLFGSVYFDRREKCDCGAPTYELKICNDCSDVHLHAKRLSNGKLVLIDDLESDDDFSLEIETSQEELDLEDDENVGEQEAKVIDIGKVIISGNVGKQSITEKISRSSRDLDSDETDALTIYLNQSIETPVRCPSCNGPNNRDYLFRPARLGAPSHIATAVQTLLEYAPEGKGEEAQGPFNGRRIITFTDSRQGTARIAAKLQQDAERNRARSLIYHHLLRAQIGAEGDQEEIDKVESELASLREAQLALPEKMKANLDPSIAARLSELAKFAGDTVVTISWLNLEASLANGEKSISKWMFEVYRNLAPNVFTNEVGANLIARMLLEREFLRRPRRANSAETMGLVKLNYPRLDKVVELPVELRDKKTLEGWHCFLKICLDYFVRGELAVEVAQQTRNWLGEKIRPKELNTTVGLNRKDAGWTVVWPKYARHAGRLPRLVNLLRAWLQLDVETPANQMLISNLLKQAFEILKSDKVGIFTKTGEGHFILELRKHVEFSLVTSAWRCPITHNVLDTTLDGITPYLPSDADPKNYVCDKISIPTYDAPFGRGDTRAEQLIEANKWLKNNSDVEALRTLGVWSNLNDRIVEQVPFVRSVEHSAQLSGTKLRQYEDEFKKGKLNILSCSTTMEMGVDIGGISVVAMNNAPPHPANYLQRSGRAGRRGESRAIAFTLCKQNPHGNLVFTNTKWPFVTPTAVPNVSFQSRVLVQRHVNALCLSLFLNTHLADHDLIKLNCVAFFGGTEEQSASPVERLLDLLNSGINSWPKNFKEKLLRLVEGTCLANIAVDALLAASAVELQKVSHKWLLGRDRLVTEKNGLLGGDKRAERAISIQLTRIECEYLLRELATNGFLPGYGFPTHIANFNTINVSQLATAERDNKVTESNQMNRHRIDNKMMARDFPSRDMVAAIREFAPGAEVVIDGQVFKSGGILLNWKAPSDQDKAREPQGFKYAWRCHSCGASGSTHILADSKLCSECGSEIDSKNSKTFTEPSGFAVDIYEATHNDISRPKYLPVREPWITANGEWVNLIKADLGRFRTTNDGHIFHFNDGNENQGYSICLECGRSEASATNEFSQFASKNGHKRLRGGKDEGSSICPGSDDDWKIKQNVSFGCEDRTDILELQLKDPTTGVFMNDREVALSIGVALRQAATQRLGISEEEVGISVSPTKVRDMETQSIYLFDRAGGGAGFMSSVAQEIPLLMKQAANRLNCSANCETSCHHCLLSYDTQFQAKYLNRKKALDFLNGNWLNSLDLPLEDQLFGDLTVLEARPLRAAITESILKSNSPKLRLYLKGNVGDWDLTQPEFKKFILQQTLNGCSVELALSDQQHNELNTEVIEQLTSYAQANILSLVKYTNKENTLIELQSGKHLTTWGCRDLMSTGGVPGEHFFEPSDISPVVRSNRVEMMASLPIVTFESNVVSTENDSSTNAYEIEIKVQLNGVVNGFGKRFWQLLHTQSTAIQEEQNNEHRIVKINYYDRYLNTPLMVALLAELIEGLRNVASQWDSPEVLIHSAPPSVPKFASSKIWDNFTSVESRDKAIESTLAYSDIKAYAYTKEKRQLPHYRRLEIVYSNGERLLVRFDQGLGYWGVDRGYRLPSYELLFNFDSRGSAMGEKIAEFKVKISNESEHHGTQIVVKHEK